MLYISKIPALQNSCSDVLHDFQRVVFYTHNTIFVFHNIRKFIIIQKFNSHHYRGLQMSCFDLEIKKKHCNGVTMH